MDANRGSFRVPGVVLWLLLLCCGGRAQQQAADPQKSRVSQTGLLMQAKERKETARMSWMLEDLCPGAGAAGVDGGERERETCW